VARAAAKDKVNAQAPAQETIQGTVIRRIFYNAENGYCVLSVNLNTGGGDLFDNEIKVTGNMPSVREGDEYKFAGNYTDHPKFGRQFKFQSSELILPSGKAGVARYLSQTTYGVGIVKAQKIVDILGENALELIKNDPLTLEHGALSFLTPEQRNDIIQDLAKNSVQATLAGMICIPGSGIGMGTVSKIMAKYGADTVRIVKENPYILSEDLFNIGFRKADTIAQAVGIEPNSPFRVEAAVDYVLKESGNEGHVFLKPSVIVPKLIGKSGLIEASGVAVADIARANRKLIDEGKCIREGDAVYASSLYDAEVNVAASIRRLLDQNVKEISGIDTHINDIESRDGIEYAPQQKEAIRTALQSNLSIITGGPGTGKTTVILAICDIYERQYPNNEIYLSAPTGRASKRMSEATGREAKTIHRLLCYNPQYGGFMHGYNDPLPGPGLLIVDEASMIDIELAAHLLAATEELQVVFVGDIDQLPSVGPGSVLRDCIASGMVPTVRLEFNYRQAGGSRVAEYANMICRGVVPPLISEGDFEYIPVEDADQAAETVLSLVRSIVSEGYGQLEWQVLAPMRRGSCGVKTLNELVRETVNPAVSSAGGVNGEAKATMGNYRLGDKVMVISNNYRLGVFNGDLGVVAGIERGRMAIDFGDFAQEFAGEDLEILTLAYASTIHKSQGSEFPVVIMPLVRQHYMMLQRNLLYTGITRAKRRLVLVADEWSVKRAVSNNVIEERFSMLAERIRDERIRGEKGKEA
jgi:exodeoxyribonuclease V alpha subunit